MEAMALIEIDGLPFLKMGGSSMAMLNNQRVTYNCWLCWLYLWVSIVTGVPQKRWMVYGGNCQSISGNLHLLYPIDADECMIFMIINGYQWSI